MKHETLPFSEVANMIADAKSITILSHINPDADTLGTSLGIYALLSQDKSKKVEISNASGSLPMYLDFLPNFHKIKHKMDYTDSLIIACDCGSIDRLGFDLTHRTILNIDHHKSNTNYGDINVIVPHYASASQVAYKLFEKLYDIEDKCATCFYTALLSDTRYFTTSYVNEEVFSVAQELLLKGANASQIAANFTQRRPLASLRILERALKSLVLYKEASVAVLFVTKEDIMASGASSSDMDGIVDYARSLATVEVALFAIELENEVRISLRSKRVDVSYIAMEFNGGGHKFAAGFTIKEHSLEKSVQRILKKIDVLEILKEDIKK